MCLKRDRIGKSGITQAMKKEMESKHNSQKSAAEYESCDVRKKIRNAGTS